MNTVPKNKQDEIQGDLFDFPDLVIEKSDCVESWIKNVELVNLWAREQEYNTHNVNWFKMPDGSLILNLKNKRLMIPAQDELGDVIIDNKKMKMQRALDNAYTYLQENFADQKYLWDLSIVKKWGKTPATDKQIVQVKRFMGNYDTSELTKLEANQILTRMFNRRRGA